MTTDFAGATASNDVSGLTFEQARDELVRIVAELEQGSTTLEAALQLWERGEALGDRCEAWLLGARTRLTAVREASLPDAGAADTAAANDWPSARSEGT